MHLYHIQQMNNVLNIYNHVQLIQKKQDVKIEVVQMHLFLYKQYKVVKISLMIHVLQKKEVDV